MSIEVDTQPPASADVQLLQHPVNRRIGHLRELAERDPALAADETWAWFIDAGRRIQSDRNAAVAELGAMFRAGSPSRGIDGPTQGILVGFTAYPVFDRVMAALTTLWLPWSGKVFNAAVSRGENLLLRSAMLPARLLWPSYRLRGAGARLSGFEFETRVEPSAVDPLREVLVIDYAPVTSNPALIIRQIRDELVEVAPGAHLGKMLWWRGGRYRLMAYFALRPAAPPDASRGRGPSFRD